MADARNGIEQLEYMVEKGDRFSAYVARFRRRLSKDAAAWARDNIFWSVGMFLAPLAVLYSQHQTFDLSLVYTTVTIYIVFFFLYLLVHIIRTPWKLDVERAVESRTLSAKLETCQQTIFDHFPKFVITTRRLWVTHAKFLGVSHGSVAHLEVHIVNTSSAPGNVQSVGASVDVGSTKLIGTPIDPMYIGIRWQRDKAPGEPQRPNIEIYPRDFLIELRDGEVLTHNRGITKWFPFFVDAPKEEVEKSVITLSIKDAIGKEFLAVSTPEPSRELEIGYRA